MASVDEAKLNEMERAVVRLASNPEIAAQYGSDLAALHRSIVARRIYGAKMEPSDVQLDQIQLLLARLNLGIDAKRRELELEMQQYDAHEKRVSALLERVEERRKANEAATKRSGSSRSGGGGSS